MPKERERQAISASILAVAAQHNGHVMGSVKKPTIESLAHEENLHAGNGFLNPTRVC